MSDTPRTDELVFELRCVPTTGKMYERMRDFARQLERELAEEKAENARLREAGKSMRDEIAELEKRVYELSDLRDEAVAANTRHVMLVLGMRKRIDAVLNALWETHGNGFGTPMEIPIAELQTALDESA